MDAPQHARLIEQLRIHLQSLLHLGVQWVPRRWEGSPVVLALPAAQESVRLPTAAAAPPLPTAGSVPAAATAVAGPSLFETSTMTAPTGSPGDRRQALEQLAAEVTRCRRCEELFATRTQTVFGVGPLDPDIAFIGEAPGADEDRQGEPFVGRAGQLLNRMIAAIGYRREDVYICNILKCRPPGNRTPTVQECRNCFPYLEQQLALVRPKYLVALGNTAARALLQTTAGVTKLRGKVYRYQDLPLICTYHPAALLRDFSGQMKREAWEDMKLLLQTMGKPIPPPRKGE